MYPANPSFGSGWRPSSTLRGRPAAGGAICTSSLPMFASCPKTFEKCWSPVAVPRRPQPPPPRIATQSRPPAGPSPIPPAAVRELRGDAADVQLGRPADAAEPDVAGQRIERDAAIVRSDEGRASARADPVEGRMPVLGDSRAGLLAVALRVARVGPVAEGEAVVPAEPDVIRLRIPDD